VLARAGTGALRDMNVLNISKKITHISRVDVGETSTRSLRKRLSRYYRKMRRIKITRRHGEALAKNYLGVLLFLGELSVVLLMLFLLTSNILDLKTVLSVLVPDLFIAIFLYYLLGQGRRGQEEEISNLFDVAEKCAHLVVYKFRLLEADFYFVENTTTQEYYKAPKHIAQMADLGAIRLVECQKGEKEMRAKLQNSHGNEAEATIIQLMPREKPISYDSF